MFVLQLIPGSHSQAGSETWNKPRRSPLED